MYLIGIIISIIEWFNLSTYNCFADQIIQDILPNSILKENKLSLFLAMLAIINIGKPIGSYLFGKYSDKTSRINAIIFSFSMMFICTITTSFIPTYKQAGYFSCILFLLLNLLKGISVGGNYSSTVYSIEKSKNKYFISSLITTGVFIGLFLAQFSTKYLSWRQTFQLSAFLSLPILFFIIKYQNKDKKIETITTEKLTLKKFLNACCLTLLDIIPYYIILSLLPNYHIFTSSNPDIKKIIYLKRTITTILLIILTPILGYFADKLNSEKTFLKISATMLLFSNVLYIYPTITISYPYFESVYYGIMLSFCYSSIYCYLPLKFHESIRAKSSGLALNSTATIVNLLIPILTILLNKNIWIINIIFILVGIISYITI